MTPTERDLLTRLFDRIDAASAGPRDTDAEALIAGRVAQNAQAPYRMAQTIAVQDEALKRAEEKIRTLEETAGWETPRSRLAEEADAAVANRRPSVPSAGQRPAGFGAGGFLAGAGQVALGIVGGTLLMEGIRGLTGSDGTAQAAETPQDTAAQTDTAASDTSQASGTETTDAGDPGHDDAGHDDAGHDYADAGMGDVGGDSDGGGFLDGLFGGDWEL